MFLVPSLRSGSEIFCLFLTVTGWGPILRGLSSHLSGVASASIFICSFSPLRPFLLIMTLPIRSHQSGAAQQPCALSRNFSTNCVPGFLHRKSLASAFDSRKWGANGKGCRRSTRSARLRFLSVTRRGYITTFQWGKHGDIFTFTMEMEGLTFPEAVERLAALAGLAMPQ
jgi:hypothetical protein